MKRHPKQLWAQMGIQSHSGRSNASRRVLQSNRSPFVSAGPNSPALSNSARNVKPSSVLLSWTWFAIAVLRRSMVHHASLANMRQAFTNAHIQIFGEDHNIAGAKVLYTLARPMCSGCFSIFIAAWYPGKILWRSQKSMWRTRRSPKKP